MMAIGIKNEMRLDREAQGIDRFEPVETSHVASSPAIRGWALEVIQDLDMPVDVYSIHRAILDLDQVQESEWYQEWTTRIDGFEVKRHKNAVWLQIYGGRLLQSEHFRRGNRRAALDIQRHGTLEALRRELERQIERLRKQPRKSELEAYLERLEAIQRSLWLRSDDEAAKAALTLARMREFRAASPANARRWTKGRPANIIRLREQLMTYGWVAGIEWAMGAGHRDLDELEAAGEAAMREIVRYDPRRGGNRWTARRWVKAPAIRAAQRARVKRVSGLSIPQRQMPLVGKIREALAQGHESAEAIAEATRLPLADVEALLPAATSTVGLEGVENVLSYEEPYEELLVKEAVADALDGLNPREKLVVEVYMYFGDELKNIWAAVLKGEIDVPFTLPAQDVLDELLEELKELTARLGEKSARAHAGKYWRSAVEFLREELEPLVS